MIPLDAHGVRARVVGTLEDVFGIPGGDLSDDCELVADLQLDSLAVVELQVALEEALDVRLPDTGPDIVTLADLVDAIVATSAPADHIDREAAS